MTYDDYKKAAVIAAKYQKQLDSIVEEYAKEMADRRGYYERVQKFIVH